MKKFLIAILMTLSFSLFAETYTVLDIYGIAKIEGSGAVVKGQELNDDDCITIIGFKDYVKLDNNLYIYGPVKNKKVKDAVSKPKLKKGNIVRASQVAPDIEKTREAVATAASRASEAKEDFDWVE